MTNTELIRQEIERLQEAQLDEFRNFNSEYKEGIFDGLSMLDRFIDSLLQAQPEVDLEKEIDKAMKSDLCPEEIGGYDFCCIARHFYELGLKARREE